MKAAKPIELVVDANPLLSPAWRSELEFQLSLLRLMYSQTSLGEGASAKMAELEQLQQPLPGIADAR
jgi:hypothetical protein